MRRRIGRGSSARDFLRPIAAILTALPAFAAPPEDRWWPVQALPQSIVRTTSDGEPAAQHFGYEMMLQSIAGLAAKAVNEGRGSEVVWVNNGNVDLENWYLRLLAQHPAVKESGTAKPWTLVERYAKQDLIKGYILYRRDRSHGASNTYRPGMNCSVNVATSLAGILAGIIVDEELEADAKAHGLARLLDVREKTQSWCFDTYKDQFNRRMLCTQDPARPHVRDLAIAQKAFTGYGRDAPIPAALEWLEPLSPILGWNGGDEFETTDLSSSFGHIQTSTDWCANLPALMAGSEKLTLPKVKSLDPKTIDWSDARSAVSFISTDGDNVQWVQGNFFHSDSYWGNPERGKIPFGWSCCFDHLAQLCPQAIEYEVATGKPNDWFIEWGGGYYFPDHFGRKRADRWALLARHARRTWELMKKVNTRIIGFNVAQCDSPDARRAYEVFAGQVDGLLAILVFQYAPYEAGAGKTFWVKDRNGIELPVITARYSIWEHANNREHAGTPAKIARDIGKSVENAGSEMPSYDWVITHAWSWFKKSPGPDENDENLPQESAVAHGGVRGYSPVTWCAERFSANIRVVSPEELVWRIRMQHDPARTKELIDQFE